jgi:type IV pilus assembly protein PilQ
VPFTPSTSGTQSAIASGLTALLPVTAATGLPIAGGNLVNLPVSGTPTGGINFGIIGTRFNLNLAVQALETKTSTRTLSRPEIVVMDNQKAVIVRGREVPYQTGTAQTGFSVAFKDAALKLEVTPTVIREPDVTKIKMKLLVENNDVGANVSTSTGTIPSINKQSTQTEVVVKEGETLVIGGTTQRTDIDNVSKVPLFGDIPILGWLFKRRTLNTPTDIELVIFVTPTVLKEAPAGTRPTAPPTR